MRFIPASRATCGLCLTPLAGRAKHAAVGLASSIVVALAGAGCGGHDAATGPTAGPGAPATGTPATGAPGTNTPGPGAPHTDTSATGMPATTPPSTGAAATMTVGAGAGQTASVGGALGTPLAVLVRDVGGKVVQGVAVDWQVAEGGGSVSAARSTTDADGRATTSWTLGLTPGPQRVVAAAAGAAPVALTATALADTTRPRLTEFALGAREVQVSDSGAILQIRFRLADAGAGVQFATATFAGPNGAQFSTCGSYGRPAEGTRSDGTWLCTARFTAYAAAGEWRVREVIVRDRADNERRYPAAELAEAGFPTAFVVGNGAADVTPPSLVGLAFAPASVDVTAADQTVHFTARVRDDRAGVGNVQFTVGPGGQAGAQGQYVRCLEMTRTEGTATDGTWSCDVVIPRGSADGTWSVSMLAATDAANNMRQLQTYELRAAGVPTDLRVTSASADTVPPALTTFAVSPARVDLGAGPATVEFTLTATDDRSGVTSVSATAWPPGVSSATGCGSVALESGTPLQGTYRCRLQLNQYGAAGEWPITVTLTDALRNSRTYDAAALRALGLPSAITVTRTP